MVGGAYAMKLNRIRCRKCGAGLISGRIFYPQGTGYVCEHCKPPVVRAQEPMEIYVETDEFTGFVPLRYGECIDLM